MKFTKMHGCGNDFIILDFEETAGRNLPELARRICDRHFGVGADGILVPAPSEVGADVRMVYHNSDGSPSEMCGNGIRCLARYARDKGLVATNDLAVETGAGVKSVAMNADGSSRVDMGPPAFGGEVDSGSHTFLRVSMGNPHAVAFLENKPEIETLNLGLIGPRAERDRNNFPEGANIEFVHIRGGHDIRMRIWERGAGETMASGSGSCAAAVAAIHRSMARSPVNVHLDGGVVEVEWDGDRTPVRMSGPTEYVCEGRFSERLAFPKTPVS